MSLVTACLVLATSASATAAQAGTSPLRILLTNDDGYEAPGLRALHSALVAAGHDVVVVAPTTNQIGASAELEAVARRLRTARRE